MRRRRIATLAAALAVCVLAVPTVARAQARQQGKAMVRVAHFSPDASYVDVYMVSLNRKQLFPNVFYKSVSSYWSVSAGAFTYEVRPAGATPESDPVIQVKGDLQAGKAYTVVAVGPKERLQGVLLRDDMTPPAAGMTKVRFLDAALNLPPVDIALSGGRVLSSGVDFPKPTRYAQLASGSYQVQARRAGGRSVLVDGKVAVRPGTVTSVALLGGAGKPRELFAFGDAAGSGAAPNGGIRTGAGGTATSSRAAVMYPAPHAAPSHACRPGACAPPTAATRSLGDGMLDRRSSMPAAPVPLPSGRRAPAALAAGGLLTLLALSVATAVARRLRSA